MVENQRSQPKKWKNAILKTISWLSCLQFPMINSYNKCKFLKLKHEAFFIKFSDFWANPDFTRGVNLGVPEVVKWPIHDSIQFFSSKYECLGIKLKKVSNVRTPKNSKYILKPMKSSKSTVFLQLGWKLVWMSFFVIL